MPKTSAKELLPGEAVQQELVKLLESPRLAVVHGHPDPGDKFLSALVHGVWDV
jgi:hypothetical protein